MQTRYNLTYYKYIQFVITTLCILVLNSFTAYAAIGPVPPSYNMTFEAQWNPPYAAGAEPVFHIGATINEITPALPGPVRNRTSIATVGEIVGPPTYNDVPDNFTEVDDNTEAARIGTTIIIDILPLISVPFNESFWIKNQITDANGNTLTMYTFYPDGFSGEDSQDVNAYVLLNGQVHLLTAPGAPSEGQVGTIESFTDTNVRLLGEISETPSSTNDSPVQDKYNDSELANTGVSTLEPSILGVFLLSSVLVLYYIRKKYSFSKSNPY